MRKDIFMWPFSRKMKDDQPPLTAEVIREAYQIVSTFGTFVAEQVDASLIYDTSRLPLEKRYIHMAFLIVIGHCTDKSYRMCCQVTLMSLAQFQDNGGANPVSIFGFDPNLFLEFENEMRNDPQAFEEIARRIIADSEAQDQEKAKHLRTLYETEMKTFLEQGQKAETMRSGKE